MASFLKGDEIIAEAQEERFTLQNCDVTFPHDTVTYCLRKAPITASEINSFLSYEKLFFKFKCFTGAYLEALIISNYYLIKEEQDKLLQEKCEEEYELD